MKITKDEKSINFGDVTYKVLKQTINTWPYRQIALDMSRREQEKPWY